MARTSKHKKKSKARDSHNANKDNEETKDLKNDILSDNERDKNQEKSHPKKNRNSSKKSSDNKISLKNYLQNIKRKSKNNEQNSSKGNFEDEKKTVKNQRSNEQHPNLKQAFLDQMDKHKDENETFLQSIPDKQVFKNRKDLVDEFREFCKTLKGNDEYKSSILFATFSYYIQKRAQAVK